MAEVAQKFTLGLKLDDYKYEARHCTSCAGCKWVDMNYISGMGVTKGPLLRYWRIYGVPRSYAQPVTFSVTCMVFTGARQEITGA